MLNRIVCRSMEWRRLLVLGVMIGLAGACGDHVVEKSGRDVDHLSDVSEADWSTLAGKRIYFGHQSVGGNILEGLAELLREHPDIGLEVQALDGAAAWDRPSLLHSKSGTNKQPMSKIRAFEAAMNAGLGDRADLAFFKFCYVDIRKDTDVDALFREYRDTIHRLEKRYPNTRFLHCTVPLTTVQSGPKAWIKKLIGRPIEGEADNINRYRFNRMLIRSYAGKGTLFDLAAFESTISNGDVVSFESEGKVYPALAAGYTYDGGHLNEIGRKRIAEQLLIFLAHAGG